MILGNYLAGAHIPLSPIGKTLLETFKREKGGFGSSKALGREPSPAGSSIEDGERTGR